MNGGYSLHLFESQYAFYMIHAVSYPRDMMVYENIVKQEIVLFVEAIVNILTTPRSSYTYIQV